MGTVNKANSSMDFLQLHKLVAFCFFPFLLTSSLVPAKADEYFIDCGSSSNTTTNDGRTFVGDKTNPGPPGVELLAASNSRAMYNGISSKLYQTATIFSSPASYRFNIIQNGTYILRLHFYAFSSLSALTTARFNVSASGYMLLPNFSGRESSDTHVLKEFLLAVNSGEFNVYFVPASSYVAFVNAIELILIPLTTTGGSPVAASTGLWSNLVSRVLQPVHRINFGGQMVSPVSDRLWRTWLPDDPYLLSKSTAKNGPIRNSRPNYQGGNATDYDAPDAVYSTAKELNVNSSDLDKFFNATWSFNVSKSSEYFVRVHFCDMISEALGAIVFNLYISNYFVWKIDPFSIAPNLAAPFYLDFLVKSDESGIINISIGPRSDTRITENAFLNGLEIMEILSTSAVEPQISTARVSIKGIVALAGLFACGIALIYMLSVWFCSDVKPDKAKETKSVESFSYWPLVNLEGGGSSTFPSLNLKLRIPFTKIQEMTNNFDEGLVVGEGGFGKVYKGILKNGAKVAVKRSYSRHGQSFPEFQTEIKVLSKIRHRHLVSPIGYCDENDEMILVYEFMERGALRDHLYGKKGSNNGLSWRQRLEICIGAAKGLHYLHTDSTGRIIHRDVKSTNILLDENYVAKVADFGLSGTHDQQDHVSIDVKGTVGYLDPEYYQCLQLTEKSDVYSFGVVLLEVLCARPAINCLLPTEEVNLADWSMACKESDQLEKIIDPLLTGKVKPSSLNKFVETAKKCLRASGADRPPMSDVLRDLEIALQLQKICNPEEKLSVGGTTADASLYLSMDTVPCFPSGTLLRGR